MFDAGKVLELKGSTRAVTTSFAADAGSEDGGGAERQMMTRGKASAGAEAARMTMLRTTLGMVKRDEGSSGCRTTGAKGQHGWKS